MYVVVNQTGRLKIYTVLARYETLKLTFVIRNTNKAERPSHTNYTCVTNYVGRGYFFSYVILYS